MLMLLRTLDQLSASGGQIVLASDRPPADINGLDARLLSRFSGGLIYKGEDIADTAKVISGYNTLDLIVLRTPEAGMAKTADRKLEIAKKIYALSVDEIGLRPEDLIFDALTFTGKKHRMLADDITRTNSLETDGLRVPYTGLPFAPVDCTFV